MSSDAGTAMHSQRATRYETPWRRLPLTGPLALLTWALALWMLAAVLPKKPVMPVQLPPISARFIELPRPPAPAPAPPVAQTEPRPVPRVQKRMAARKATSPAAARLDSTAQAEPVAQVEQALASNASIASTTAAQVMLPGGAGNFPVTGKAPRFANHPGAAVPASVVGVIPPPQDLTIANEENPFDDGQGQGWSPGGWMQESAAEECIAIVGEEGPCDKSLFSQPGRPWCYDANPLANWDEGSCRMNLSKAVAAYKHKDYLTALAEFTRLAEKDYAPAQANLGAMYAEGVGVPKDAAQAAHWYRRAGAAGDAKASYNLALMYSDGSGVPVDHTQAAYWYRKAAYAGYAVAQYNLGVLYALGTGVPRDDKQAAFWYRKAALRGNAESQYNLAVLYAEGAGVPRDERKAVYWYCKGTIRNEEKAQASLAQMVAAGAALPNAAELKYFCWLLSADKRHSFIAYQDRHLYEKDLDGEQRARAIAAVDTWKER